MHFLTAHKSSLQNLFLLRQQQLKPILAPVFLARTFPENAVYHACLEAFAKFTYPLG